MVLNCLCPWISHHASLDLTCIWAAWGYGRSEPCWAWHPRKPGLPQSAPSLEPAVVVSVSETCTLAHTFIIRTGKDRAPGRSCWKCSFWSVRCIVLVKRDRTYGMGVTTDFDYENLGLGFHFSSSWKGGYASIPTNLCFWLWFQGDGSGRACLCAWKTDLNCLNKGISWLRLTRSQKLARLRMGKLDFHSCCHCHGLAQRHSLGKHHHVSDWHGTLAWPCTLLQPLSGVGGAVPKAFSLTRWTLELRSKVLLKIANVQGGRMQLLSP